MELSKKDKTLIGIAGVLLVIVVIVYAMYYGGSGDVGDKPTAEGLEKPSANRGTPSGKP